MDMQQRVSSISSFPNRSELQRLGSQELWDLAQEHCQNAALLKVVRDILYPRRTGLAASAVRWIDDQLASIGSPKPRWKIAALLTAAAIAIAGGIAHGAGVSIWTELIKPIFVGT
jgi:hypothetical protein